MRDTDVAGPAFPFAIDPATGGVRWETGREKLADNIRVILSTRVGERPMNRNFGTPIRELVHEPNGGGLARLIARHAREALTELEPRVVVTDVAFETVGGELLLELRYTPADEPRLGTLRLALR